MAPEQARGSLVDKRADIFAFGAVLFEMLTGRRAFTGETLADVLASVVKDEPDLSALPVHLYGPLRKLFSPLRICCASSEHVWSRGSVGN
jgi:serine/threonine protein kinase